MSNFSSSFHKLIEDFGRCGNDAWKQENELQIKMNNFLADIETKNKIDVDSIDAKDITYLASKVDNKNTNERLRKSSFLILLRIFLESTNSSRVDELKSSIQNSIDFLDVNTASLVIIQILIKYQNNEEAFKRGLDLLHYIYSSYQSDGHKSKRRNKSRPETFQIHLEYDGGFKKIDVDDSQIWYVDSNRFKSLVASAFGVQPNQITMDSHHKSKELQPNQVVTVTIKDKTVMNTPKSPIICEYKNEKKIISAATGTPIPALIDIINHVFDITTACCYCLKGNRSIDITQKDVLCSIGYNHGDVIEVIDLFDQSEADNIKDEFIKLLFQKINNENLKGSIYKILESGDIKNAIRTEVRDMKSFIHSFSSRSTDEIMFYLNLIINDDYLRKDFIDRHGFNKIVDLILKERKISKEMETIFTKILEQEQNVQYKLRNILVFLYTEKYFKLAGALLKKSNNAISEHFLPEPKVLENLLQNYSPQERQEFMDSIKGHKEEMNYLESVMNSSSSGIFETLQNAPYINKLNSLTNSMEARDFYEEVVSNSKSSHKFFLSAFNDCKKKILEFAGTLVFPMFMKDESLETGTKLMQKIADTLNNRNISSFLNQFSEFAKEKSRIDKAFLRNGKSDKQNCILSCILELIEPKLTQITSFEQENYIELVEILDSYINHSSSFDHNAEAILNTILHFPPNIIISNAELPQALDDDDDDGENNYQCQHINDRTNKLDEAVCMAFDTPELIYPFLEKIENLVKSNIDYISLYDMNFVMLLLLEKCVNGDTAQFKKLINLAKSVKRKDLKILKISSIFEEIKDIHEFVEEMREQHDEADEDEEDLYGFPLLVVRILLMHKDNQDDDKYIKSLRTCLVIMHEREESLFTGMINPYTLRLFETNKLQQVILASVPFMDDYVKARYITEHEIDIVKSIHSFLTDENKDPGEVCQCIFYLAEMISSIWESTDDRDSIRTMITEIVNKHQSEFKEIRL